MLLAVRHRDDIEAVLARYRTKKAAPEPLSEQEAAALADSVADDEDPEGATELERFPFKPYCRTCGRDTTTVTSYDDETTDLAYTCTYGHTHTTNLATQNEGKLVWKVDWPMRWAFEHVDFEPAGMDHATPGSSFTVGHELVEKVFGMPRPAWFGYGFVGFAGVQKMSSSAGGAPTAEDALRVLEAPILRWLYVRRNPKQTFDIDFGPEVVRLYDEWDSLARKAADPDKRDLQVLAWERASATAAGPLPAPRVVVPFRLLSSVADVTAGQAEQISRIVGASPVDGPPAAARQGDGVDQRVRRPGRPHDRARVARRGHARLAGRPSSAPGCGCCSTGSASRCSSTPSRRWSTACPSWRAGWRSTTSRPTRSRPTRRSSSGCSTACWSTPSAARGCPPW